MGRAFAANGRFDEGLPHLEHAVRRGAGFDLSTFAELEAAPDSARLHTLREAARKNMTPVAPSQIFVTLQDESLDPVSTVSSRHPLGLNPTTGVVAGDHFYTVVPFPDAIAAAAGLPQPRSHILRARLR